MAWEKVRIAVEEALREGSEYKAGPEVLAQWIVTAIAAECGRVYTHPPAEGDEE